MNHNNVDVKVSVAEVCEVRGSGLEAAELLALAAAAADRLPDCPPGSAFDADHFFITNKGEVKIDIVPSTTVNSTFHPPEWQSGGNDSAAAAVFCIGTVLRVSGAEDSSDADLFSLVNILTVAMVGTRPTASRMGSMARNQLRGRDPRRVIMTLYEEIMGDEESNQLPDDMSSMDEDDLDVLDERPTPLIKKAAQYHQDEERGASSSTSSGNSTQKDPSPFDEIEEEIVGHVDQTVPSPSPIPPPRRPSAASDKPSGPSETGSSTTVLSPTRNSLNGIGSPIGNSTRLEESHYEETSINLSPEKQPFVVDEFASQSKPAIKKATPVNPFDDDDDMDESQKSSLSGRDPFADEMEQRDEQKMKHAAEDQHRLNPKRYAAVAGGSSEFRDFVPKPQTEEPVKQRLDYRFSSSSDEIVEATIEDDEEILRAQERREKLIAAQRERSSPQIQQKDRPRFPPPVTPHWQNSFAKESSVDEDPMPSPVLAPPRSARLKPSTSREDLDRLKQETDNLREKASRLAQNHAAAVQDMDAEQRKTTERAHVDPVVVIKRPSELDALSDGEEDIDALFNKQPNQRTHLSEESVVSPIVDDSPILQRRNSLAPSRISGRQSASVRGKRKTRAVPEFYDHSRHPSIRLKAPSAKKKKMSLLRIEQSDVYVELLNGQRIEVMCRTDAIARDIFSLVVQHMNINEHVFFGLSVMREGEHFFLEDHQRLEKYAPSGWKAGLRPVPTPKTQYVLYLRFRFYPQMRDFIKTDVTMHELYLQCRRDVIEDRIQPKRDAAFEMAALALQAEFGNRPPPVVTDYFDNHHYLPKRFCSNDDPKRLQSMLAEMHGQHANLKSEDAEHMFIQICQRHAGFGAHFHRVFRSKPVHSGGASPFDADVGGALWIGIMPRGISVYETRSGVRERLSDHQWQDTQTLQFDRKKFVIIAIKDGEQTETVLYTDHHSKSSYFVKFSATQHRFMMKMRQWKSTLKHENSMQAMPDVCVEGREVPTLPRASSSLESPLDENAENIFAKMPAKSSTLPAIQRTGQSTVSTPSSEGLQCVPQREDSRDESMMNPSDHFEASYVARDQDMNFSVVLNKDPASGLGLTLVDGDLNGVQGVYVKSVADNGAGMKAGLLVGDRLIAVNGESLHGADRHSAVQFVKKSGNAVRMDICRLDGIVRHEKTEYPKPVELANVNRHQTKLHHTDIMSKRQQFYTSGEVVVPIKKISSMSTPSHLAAQNSAQKGQSRTPPAPRRAANRRVRAVSDFGAIGDTLPVLDSEAMINIKAISGLHLDESDDEQGEYRLPQSSMYHFDNREDDSPTEHSLSPPPADISKLSSPAGSIETKRKHRYARRSNASEWADLDEVEEDDEEDIIEISLERNDMGSLGVQIASVEGRVCIKQLTAEPAATHPDIEVGMQLISVNGHLVSGHSHQDVVGMLRSGDNTVVLGLRRAEGDSNRLSVVLERQPGTTIGISLAKRTGTEGIFIRRIDSGSLAQLDGTLRVGDRLVSLDGQSVSGLSPTAILDRLKVAIGSVKIIVSRQH